MMIQTVLQADRTPSEPITSLIACHQSIEMAPVKLPPLFIATVKKERVLRISQKESRDKGTNIFSSCGGSYDHHALAVLSVVSSNSQSGFFRWHWLCCLRVQQQSSESQRATFDHYLFFGSSRSFVGQKRQRTKSSPTIVRTDASDSRGTMCQVRPWYCWILHSANEISGWRPNCLLRMSSMQAYVVHQQLTCLCFLLSSISLTNLVEANITRRPECVCEMCHHDKCQKVRRPEWKRAVLSTCHFSSSMRKLVKTTRSWQLYNKHMGSFWKKKSKMLLSCS
jgi:hypothetical protein